jgi:hypothetical protein
MTSEATEDAEDEAASEIFGVFDGMTSVLGVIAGLLTKPKHLIITAAIGLAVASAVGMGAGEYLGDSRRRLRIAFVMAGATALGTMLPVVPLLIFRHRLTGEIWAGVVTLALTTFIAHRRKRWLETFGVLAVVAVATTAVALLTGAAG